MDINRTWETSNGSYDWNDPSWIVVHYTAGGWGVTAEANAQYYYREGGNVQCGTHYFVGDDGIYASTPEGRGAWTNGNYEANTHAISIEVACGSDEPCFTDTERELLRELVCDIMERYGIDADHVIRHYDVVDNFGGSTLDPHKNCPRPYIDEEAWAELHDYITGEGEPDMDMNDRITDGYIMDGTTYATVGNCIYWAERNAEQALSAVNTLADQVNKLSEKVEALSIGGGTVDYAALAKAVCDEQAKRMAE